MKSILVLLFTLVFNYSFSQKWEVVVIDENVNLSLPTSFEKTLAGNSLAFTASTSTGVVYISSNRLADTLKFDDTSIDFLKHYVDGYIAGMEMQSPVTVLENNEVVINNRRFRNLLLKSSEGQLNQYQFFVANRKMYIVRFKETSAPSDVDRKSVFSSIQIN